MSSISACGRPRIFNPYAAFCRTVIQGKIDSPSNTIALSGLARSERSTTTLPLVGLSRPASIRSSVVLPQPLGPTIMKNSPVAISSEK